MDSFRITAGSALGVFVVALSGETLHLDPANKPKPHVDVETHQPLERGRFQYIVVASGSTYDSNSPIYVEYEKGSGGYIVSSGYPTVKFRG